MSRLLEPAEFGVFAVALALTGVATIFADFGLSLSSIRAKSVSDAEKSNLFWTNLLLGTSMAAAIWTSAPLIAGFYGLGSLEAVLKALSICLVLASATAQFRAELSRNLRFTSQTVVDILSPWIALFLAIGLAFAGLGIWALVMQQIALFASQFIGLALFARWRPSWPSRRTSIRAHLRFGVSTAGIQIINYISQSADVFVLGKLQSPAVLGVYNRAFQLYKIPGQQLANPLGRVAIPFMSKSFHRGTLGRDAPTVQLVMAYSVLQGFALLAGLASPIVVVFLGARWEAAGPIVQLLCIGGAFQALSWSYFWIFVASDQTQAQFRWSLIGRIGMVAAVLVAASSGAYAVAMAVSLGYMLVWGLLTLFVVPKAGLTRRSVLLPVVRPLLLAALVFIASIGVSHSILNDWMPILRITGGLAGALAAAGLVALFSAYRRDFRQVAATLKGNR